MERKDLSIRPKAQLEAKLGDFQRALSTLKTFQRPVFEQQAELTKKPEPGTPLRSLRELVELGRRREALDKRLQRFVTSQGRLVNHIISLTEAIEATEDYGNKDEAMDYAKRGFVSLEEVQSRLAQNEQKISAVDGLFRKEKPTSPPVEPPILPILVYQGGELTIVSGSKEETVSLNLTEQRLLRVYSDQLGELVVSRELSEKALQDPDPLRAGLRGKVRALQQKLDQVAPGMLEIKKQGILSGSRLAVTEIHWFEAPYRLDETAAVAESAPVTPPVVETRAAQVIPKVETVEPPPEEVAANINPQNLQAVRRFLADIQTPVSELAEIAGLKPNGQTVGFKVMNMIKTTVMRLQLQPERLQTPEEQALLTVLDTVIQTQFDGNRDAFFADCDRIIKHREEISTVVTAPADIPAEDEATMTTELTEEEEYAALEAEEAAIEAARAQLGLEIVYVARSLKTHKAPDKVRKLIEPFSLRTGELFAGKDAANIKSYKAEMKMRILEAVETEDGAISLMEQATGEGISEVIAWLYQINQETVRSSPEAGATTKKESVIEIKSGLEARDGQALERIRQLIHRLPPARTKDGLIDGHIVVKTLGIHEADLVAAIGKGIVQSSQIPTDGHHYQLTPEQTIRLAYYIKHGRLLGLSRKVMDKNFAETYGRALAKIVAEQAALESVAEGVLTS